MILAHYDLEAARYADARMFRGMTRVIYPNTRAMAEWLHLYDRRMQELRRQGDSK